MQQQKSYNDADIVLQVDPSTFPRRNVAKRVSAPTTPPLPCLTISIPITAQETQPDKHGHSSSLWHPPQEIIIGEVDNGKKKPPRTITVKDSSGPPSVVVIVDKQDERVDPEGIPTVIQVQEMATKLKSRAATGKRIERGVDQGVPSLPRTDHPVYTKNAPVECEAKKTKSSGTPLMDESSLMLHSQTAMPEISNKRDEIQPHPTDLPEPGAETNQVKKLPDFSAMLANRRNNTQIATRRRNILDVPSAHSDHSDSYRGDTGQGYGPLSNSHTYMTNFHESWPAVSSRSSTLQNPSSSSNRMPQWLGVTGSAEEWIRATKPDDILEVGRKIAQHRIPES